MRQSPEQESPPQIRTAPSTITAAAGVSGGESHIRRSGGIIGPAAASKRSTPATSRDKRLTESSAAKDEQFHRFGQFA